MPKRPNPSPGFRKRSPASKPAGTGRNPQPANTAAQDKAHEAALLTRLETTHGCKLTPGQVKANDATIRVGYLNLDAGLAFEIHPKQGGLNSGVKRKISADVLKLSLLRQHYKTTEDKDITVGVVLGDQISLDDYLGKKGPSWMREAARLHEVAILNLPREQKAE
ncbi:hypothetical protein [Neolewinella antarctica]|uniref:Uncharacterized protein n=1 Tax=Neolewinella antarctica TaxID=442734 RepID=A0ABX0XGB7_9BACT|nr:hypothetical protein [Neolewinella antarctica]NJC28374.1 hypothetical protein [Neolewinella antarctica]